MSVPLLLLALSASGDPQGPTPVRAFPPLRVDPAVSPGAVPPVIEPGIRPDFLSPDVLVVAALAVPRALGLIAPRATPTVVTPVGGPTVVFREGMNLTRRGQPHWWEHFAEKSFPDRLREPLKDAVRTDVMRKYEGGLNRIETIRFQGQKIEYRPYEFAPGQINIGTAMPSSGYVSPLVRYGWPAGLGATALIPSSAPQPRGPSLMPGWSQDWSARFGVAPLPSLPEYGLGVNIDLTPKPLPLPRSVPKVRK